MSQPINNLTASQYLSPVDSIAMLPRQPANVPVTASSLDPTSQPQVKQNQGFCAQISAIISCIFAAIRGCLASIPLIGRLVTTLPEQIPVTPIQATSIQPERQLHPDAARYGTIENLLGGSPRQAALTNEEIAEALAQFTAMESDYGRAKAFELAIMGAHSTVHIAIEFYRALPQPLKDKFKELVFAANNHQDEGRGTGFGDYFVHSSRMHSAVANRAVLEMVSYYTNLAQHERQARQF
jgi:hypothetical protein